MSTGSLAPVLKQRFFDANGLPLSGGLLYSYQAGTTTPQATYTDSSLVTPNTNPVVLDSSGQADVWLDPTLSYKFVLKDSLASLQWTTDNVVGSLVANSVATASIQDGAVTTPKLADGAVTIPKIASQIFGPETLTNFGLAAAVGSSNLTMTLKDGAGGIPNAGSPVLVAFRDATSATGILVLRQVTSAITGTVLSGSTLGSKNAVPNAVYVYLLDSAGTVEFAWSASDAWDEGSVHNSSADGGTATSDAALYSNIARTGVAVRLMGRIISTQATAGTWATALSEISLIPFKHGLAYFQGYHDNTGQWNANSATFADPTIVTPPALVKSFSNGLSVVTEVSGLPGITFTPKSITDAFFIKASITLSLAAGTSVEGGAQLTDGTNSVDQAVVSVSGTTANGSAHPMTMSGLFAPGTISPFTVKLQLQQANGSAVLAGGSLTTSINWTVIQVS